MPEIDDFGAAIMGAMVEHFGNAILEIVIEPGRFLVADAGVVSTEVVLVSRKAENDPVRWSISISAVSAGWRRPRANRSNTPSRPRAMARPMAP